MKLIKMKLWIARDKDRGLRLWFDRPTKGRDGNFSGALVGSLWESLFPEVTWGNSPLQVELKLIEE